MKTVLITGASGGIGQALVARFERAGWKVFACDRRGNGLHLDVTDEASVRSVRAEVGVPDVIVNNAGIGLLGPIVELPDEVLAKQFDVNVRGPARLARAFAPDMCARGHGRFINVSSMVGLFTLPWFGAYAASKHAMEAVSDAMRLELAPFGVKVAVVEPSIVGTGFVDAAIQSLERAAPGSAWEAPLRNTIASAGDFSFITVTPERVAETIFRAATARSPRSHYRVGWLGSLGIRAAKLLPAFVLDAILRAMVGFRAPSAPRLQRQTPLL